MKRRLPNRGNFGVEITGFKYANSQTKSGHHWDCESRPGRTIVCQCNTKWTNLYIRGFITKHNPFKMFNCDTIKDRRFNKLAIFERFIDKL